MASTGQMTGMTGVYLVAAELSKRNLIVSSTSRNAYGADLLVTDQNCENVWTVQVKTNKKPTKFWLVGEKATTVTSATHVYVFVNLRGEERPEYIVARSKYVAGKIRKVVRSTGSVWYAFDAKNRPQSKEGWELFGKGI